MADIHIEDFYRDSAKILLKLYGHFPRRGDIYVDEISGHFELDEFGIPSARHQACFSCMRWLAEEQYLRYQDQSRQDGLGQAVLSQNAFMALARPTRTFRNDLTHLPASVADQQATLAHQLRGAIKRKDNLTIKTLLHEFFGFSISSGADKPNG